VTPYVRRAYAWRDRVAHAAGLAEVDRLDPVPVGLGHPVRRGAGDEPGEHPMQVVAGVDPLGHDRRPAELGEVRLGQGGQFDGAEVEVQEHVPGRRHETVPHPVVAGQVLGVQVAERGGAAGAGEDAERRADDRAVELVEERREQLVRPPVGEQVGDERDDRGEVVEDVRRGDELVGVGAGERHVRVLGLQLPELGLEGLLGPRALDQHALGAEAGGRLVPLGLQRRHQFGPACLVDVQAVAGDIGQHDGRLHLDVMSQRPPTVPAGRQPGVGDEPPRPAGAVPQLVDPLAEPLADQERGDGVGRQVTQIDRRDLGRRLAQPVAVGRADRAAVGVGHVLGQVDPDIFGGTRLQRRLPLAGGRVAGSGEGVQLMQQSGVPHPVGGHLGVHVQVGGELVQDGQVEDGVVEEGRDGGVGPPESGRVFAADEVPGAAVERGPEHVGRGQPAAGFVDPGGLAVEGERVAEHRPVVRFPGAERIRLPVELDVHDGSAGDKSSGGGLRPAVEAALESRDDGGSFHGRNGFGGPPSRYSDATPRETSC